MLIELEPASPDFKRYWVTGGADDFCVPLGNGKRNTPVAATGTRQTISASSTSPQIGPGMASVADAAPVVAGASFWVRLRRLD